MSGSTDKNLKFFQNHNSMNGLVNFIAEMRTCRIRDLEQKRVNKELANIRSKFKDPNLNGYNKKKYICKLLYMYIIGYEIDFGHVEAVNLLNSAKYSEKQIGYLAVTLLVNETNDLIKLVVHSIRKDLMDSNEISCCLALHAIANIGGKDLSESLVEDIFKLFTSNSVSSFVKKKAGLCLLKIYRRYPEIIPVNDWAPDILKVLDDKNLGVLHSAACLVTALVQTYPDQFSGSVTKVISKLNQIVVYGDFDAKYLYYKIPAPWLQIRLLRILQYYPARKVFLSVAAVPTVMNELESVMKKVISSTDVAVKNHNQLNALNSVLFETVNLALHVNPSSPLIDQACRIFGSFLNGKDTNLRYLSMETMAHVAATGDPLKMLGQYQNLVIQCLNEKEDISIRRRALDLLYSMCNKENARVTVEEMLNYLSNSDYEFQEELVLKIAIVAEKFVTEYTWYVDVILKLITTAGDAASDSLWFRVVQIVTNVIDLREYAAYTILQAVKQPHCHEVTLKIAGHILGEFGHIIVESPGCSPFEQFMALHSKFGLFSSSTRAILLSTYLKFINLFPEIKGEIIKVFEVYQHVLDTELQQRACEFLTIAKMDNEQILQTVCEEMPHYPDRGNLLLNQLTKKVNDTEDLRTWTIGGKEDQKDLKEKREQLVIQDTEPPQPKSTSRAASPTQKQTQSGFENAKLQHCPGTPESIIANYKKLLSQPNGVLYEDNFIQIGVKAEYQGHLGRIALFFGNKTKSSFTNVSVTEAFGSLNVEIADRIASTIPGTTQMHQMYNIQCDSPKFISPSITIQFYCEGDYIQIPITLPLILTKFVSNCVLTSDDFFSRWKQIGGPPKEVQVTVNTAAVDVEKISNIISGVSFSILPEIDPNPDNVTFAGIFSSSKGKVGCLGRVESHREYQVIRTDLDVSYHGSNYQRRGI
ncbi:hypothetical protein HDV01_005619 [Terramyces sp. JEL0728]|nr:hypothetical protein HDV01_005619 [Terramyces sp. JEL0728]